MDRARCYEILEVRPGASWDEIRHAYRELAQVWHPDRFEGRPGLRRKAEARFQEINDAYQTLSASLRPVAGSGAEGQGGTGGALDQVRVAPEGRGPTGANASDRPGRWAGWRSRAVARLRACRGKVASRRVLLGIGVLTAAAIAIAFARAALARGFTTRDGNTVRFTQVSGGGRHACGLDRSGTVYCWGSDDSRQLGNGEGADVCGNASTVPCSPEPRRVNATVRFTAVAAGWSHTCALGRDGATSCWGAGFAGQTGTGRTEESAEPTPVPGLRLEVITTFGQHTCGLAADGIAFCWGSNDSGQLGSTRITTTCLSEEGPFACSPTPVRVETEAAWTTVSAGGSHTCGIDRAGTAWCWGSSRSGQAGPAAADLCGRPGAAYACQRLPRPVGFAGGFVAISAGAAHTCGLARSGEAWCWGDNQFGQLGDGTSASSAMPVAAAGNHTFQSLEARGHLTCGAGRDARTYCWGQLPTGTANAPRQCRGVPCAPVPIVLRLPPGALIAGGFEFACIIAGRSQRCVGRNDSGQVGNGASIPYVPVAVSVRTTGEQTWQIPLPFGVAHDVFEGLIWVVRRFFTRLFAPILRELDRLQVAIPPADPASSA